ncbi:MAG: transporter substrate-binding domain-containing protein, partial [Campylobacterota bacterium]|nr:transporter substrate-binding domain-containing protein [Campylobacterota bacterium]
VLAVQNQTENSEVNTTFVVSQEFPFEMSDVEGYSEDVDIDKFIVNNSKYNGYKKDIFFTKAEKEWIKNNTIEVATTSSWSPFNFLNKDDELVGIGMDYWELISKKAGLKSNINEIKNFTEVLDGIKNKKYDLNIATSRTEDKAKYGLFSDTYEKFPISIAAKATENFIAKPEILSGKKVAVGKDYSSYHLLKKRFPNIDFILVKNTKEALEFVSKGFAYACVDVEPALHYQIVKNNFDDIKIIGSTSVDFDVQVMIRDDYQQLQIILNKAIGMITKEEMVSIYKRWMTIHSKEKFDYKLLVQLFSVGLVIFIILLYRQKLLKKYNMKLEKSINKATKDLKKQNFKLQESVDNFQNLFDTTMEMIVLFKMDGEIIEINKPGVVLSGYKNKKDLIGRNISEFILDTDMEKVKKSMQNDMPEPYELEMINKDGSKVNTLISGRNIIRDSKKIRIATIIDLTEMKEKDRTIQEQSKLVLMGEMISMIAHQWRQPLNILGTINMKIETKLEFGEIMTAQTYEPISDSINKQLQYLSKTIDDFRDFFKPDKEKKYTTLKELVNSSLSIVGASISSKQIEIIKEFNCENEINTYTSEVTQVILNIIKNAEDILLEKEIKDPFIKIVTYKKDAKNRSVLEISDNGGGIQKDIMDKIFEPYFSTKLEKHGTGLGLYMSKIIIEEHCGGKLTVKNRDKGVVFKISL